MQSMYSRLASSCHLVPWAIFFLFATAASQAIAAPPARDFLQNDLNATNRIIIRLRAHPRMRQDEQQFVSRLAAQHLSLVRRLPDDARVYRLPAQLPLPYARTLARKIASDPNVLYAEPDVRLTLDSGVIPRRSAPAGTLHARIALAPNDPLFANQWNLTNPVVGINAPGAWAMTTGSSSVTVAVLDSGAMMTHPDLHDRLVAGYDFVDNDGDPTDHGEGGIQWHGSGTASIIGAVTNNGAGMAGVNWTSPILVVRIGTGSGAYSSDMADGIYWAAGLPVNSTPPNKTPARVLNVSFNGHGPCPASVQQAIDAARARGAVIIVAAGNYNQDAAGTQPGNCRGVITVAATDGVGNRAAFSNYGLGVTVAAPGASLVTAGADSSPWAGGSSGYLIRSGTSFAAPQVAGIVSLMLSVNPALTPDDVESILRSSVRAYPRYANCSGICHTGIVNAQMAVWLSAPDAVKAPRPVIPTPPATGKPDPDSKSPPPDSSDNGQAGKPPLSVTPGNGDAAGTTGISGGAGITPPPQSQSSTDTGTGNAAAAPGKPSGQPPVNGNAATSGNNSPPPVNPPPLSSTAPATGSASSSTSTPALTRFVRAIAGANQTAAPGSRVILRGAGQADNTARIVSYKWIQLTGPLVPLSNSRAAQPFFVAPLASTPLSFRLIVIDNRGHAAAADTRVAIQKPAVSVTSRPAAKKQSYFFIPGWW